MIVVSCPRCGGDVPLSEAEIRPQLTVSCPACTSRFEVSVSIDGAETLFQPQLLSADDPSPAASTGIDPSATVPLGSGTAMLDTPLAADEHQPPLATVVQVALILAGAEPGSERFTLSASLTTVGRESADIVIPDPAMSSRHFEIEVRGSESFVRDLESSNGTFLNGNRIRAAELVSGDTIRAGQSSFAFRIFEAIAVDPPD
jgi:DNA-directed RNA polymerase subunit RPC12/RpoP